MTAVQRRGWLIVAGLSFVSCVVLGTTNCTIGIFILPVMTALHASAERVSQATTAFVVANTVVAPLVGWLLDRVGARVIMVCGAMLAAAGYFLAAKSQTVGMYTFALAFGGAGVGGCTYVPGVFVISRCVEERRQALAFGLLLAGSSVGAAIFPIWITQLVVATDWRTALQWIAVISLSIAVPVLLWLVPRLPSRGHSGIAFEMPPKGFSVRQAFGSSAYWLLTLVQMLVGISYMGIYYFVVPYFLGSGYSSPAAARLFGAIGVAAMVGFLVFGALAGRIGPKWSLALGLIFCTAGAFLILPADHDRLGMSAAIAFVIAWGATFSLPSQLTPVLLADLLGPRHFGFLFGINNLLIGLASSLGPLLTGHLYDSTQSYAVAFKVSGLLMVFAVAAMLMVRVGSSRMHD